jgi:hypothetical protein
LTTASRPAKQRQARSTASATVASSQASKSSPTTITPRPSPQQRRTSSAVSASAPSSPTRTNLLENKTGVLYMRTEEGGGEAVGTDLPASVLGEVGGDASRDDVAGGGEQHPLRVGSVPHYSPHLLFLRLLLSLVNPPLAFLFLFCRNCCDTFTNEQICSRTIIFPIFKISTKLFSPSIPFDSP